MSDIVGIGLQHFATRVEARKFERAVARGLAEDARERKFRFEHGLSCIKSHMESLLIYGIAKPAIAEALAILIDAVSDADHSCNLDIDAAGDHFDAIDLSEARAMLDGLRS